MRARNDEGVALIMSLLLMMVLSAVAISLIFLANTETYSSMNYRLMSQARYGAESGVHKAMNYLFNTYPVPGGAGDPLTNYDMTKSPVTFGGQPIVLSSLPSVTQNYPLNSVKTAFADAAQGQLSVGLYNVSYGVTATLMSMSTFTAYGSGVLAVVQTWKITADGTIGGARPADVEVTATLEQQKVPINTFGVFATNAVCGALSFGGGETTDSYDSTAALAANGTPVIALNTGDVGTNGNLTQNGTAVVNGTLNTPRTGVGKCSAGAVDALTQNGKGSVVTQGVIELPQALSYPVPPAPSPMPPTTGMDPKNGCGTLGLSAPATCIKVGSSVTINPNGSTVVLGNLSLTAGETLHLQAGKYNVNTIKLIGNSTLVIDQPPAGPAGAVSVNVAGQGDSTPLDFGGGSIQNASYKPEDFEILYAGSGTLKVSGGAASSAMVFAPNANVTLVGGSDFYGEILGATVTDTGGTHFHYDRSLKKKGYAPSNYMLSAFTWRKNQ